MEFEPTEPVSLLIKTSQYGLSPDQVASKLKDVSNAIKVGLKALGVKYGDEVITQSFNFIATIEAILDLGAKPIITKIDDSLNMCPDDLKKKINSKTKAVIPVHMLGFSADMSKISKICREKNIPILEMCSTILVFIVIRVTLE